MKGLRLGKFGIMLASFLLTCGLLLPAMAQATHGCMGAGLTPMIFVHGGAGSAAQFESQAMRFASNGYPPDLIVAHEYDSQFTINTMEDIWDGLDQRVSELKAKYSVEKVDILGHSLGTTVMHGYLAFPERAANVAHYVNIDGRTADAPPGGVPTLALWAGRGTPGREIVGAVNVTIPDQTHVQVATSEESFVEMYRFFRGKDPFTQHILPEPFGRIKLAGRAVLFPQNIAVPGASVEIWEVCGRTGHRIHSYPEAVYSIGVGGAWGPFMAKAGRYYEFNIIRADGSNHPFYYQPFIRSDYLIRLNTAPSDGGLAAYMDRSDVHANLLVGRNKELWGDQGVDNDILAVNGVNIVNAATCPIVKRTNYMFVFDQNADGMSNPDAPVPFYHAITFFSGLDLFLPGSAPPDDTIRLVLMPRGAQGRMQVINVPNIASSSVRCISVQFNDYIQDMDSWTDYVWPFFRTPWP